MAEFKIGRLRYTWSGQWDTGTFYNRDAVAQFNGKAYICLEPHTSGDFYVDLSQQVNDQGASTPYWEQMLDGSSWLGDWEPNTYYSLNNLVKYGGKVYRCTTHHTSGVRTIDLTKWTEYTQYDSWQSNWTVDTVYGVNDVVKYGGIVYRCITNHVSAATTALGLEADQAKWQLVDSGIEYKLNWTPNTRYKVQDLVRLGTDIYSCDVGHTSGSSFDATKWTLWLPGLEYSDTWNSGTIYQADDIVIYGGYTYRSKTINNQGNTPSTSTDNWETVSQGYNMRGEWSLDVQYKIGDVVRRHGQLYSAIADNSTSAGAGGVGGGINADPSAINLATTKVAPVYTWDANSGIFGGTLSQGPLKELVLGQPTYYTVLNFGVATEFAEVVAGWTAGQSVTLTVAAVPTPLQVAYTVLAAPSGSTVLLSDTYVEPKTILGATFTGIDYGNRLTVASSVGVLPGMIALGVGFTRGQTVVSVINSTTVLLNEKYGSAVTTGQAISFTGVNYAYWKLDNVGVYWAGFWEQGTEYVVGDVVVWNNGTYRCIQNNSSTTGGNGEGGIGLITTRPDNDITNTFWVPYAMHNRNNAMRTQGDLLTVNANHLTTNVEIGTGTEDFVLRATDNMPVWKKILVVNKVYYVASDIGVDDVTYGDTLDKPWKTIKYACEQVMKGTENQNANYLLKQNKQWLVEEMYQWMLFQSANNNAPFTTTSVFDETATKRDAELIIDAVSYDFTRGGNSQSVAATIRYFADGSQTTFFNDATDAAQEYIVASLSYLQDLIEIVIQQTEPTVSYQTEMGVVNPIEQFIDPMIASEPAAFDTVAELMAIPLTAIAAADLSGVPQPYQKISSTIFIKTGTYSEELPIIVPENTALVGDELRGTVVQPKTSVFTTALRTFVSDNSILLDSSEGLVVDMPIQFATPSIDRLAGVDLIRSDITMGTTYYVQSISNNSITISETIGGSAKTLINSYADMEVMAGDCLQDMFRVRNGTGIRNMSCTGLMGTLTVQNEFQTRRPSGGAFVALDPGTGPDDTTAWILKRSPYIQNVTNFGTGCTGLKIDGTLHNGGNKSIVANDFTQILSDGVGVWCKGSGSLTECVSVFTYYNYAGYFAEDGGRIRATNGNSSYGTYGCIAEGYDDTEVPISGLVDNQSTQVQASVQSAFGVSAELLKMQYSNAGSGYNTIATNLLTYSNDFITGWTSDGNVTLQKNLTSPSGYSDGWTLTGLTSTTDSSYIYQNINISPAGKVYTALSGVNITGLGSSATFDITVGSTAYSVTVNNGGTNYVSGNQINIYGSQLGGVDGINDCVITVTSLAGSSIQNVTVQGTVPDGSALPYTFSIYAQKGSSASIDIYATFSGSSSVSSFINYNFNTQTFTPGNTVGGMLPTSYDALELSNNWYRLSYTFYDAVALNNALQIRIYPRSKAGPSGFTRLYGAQLEIGSSPSFYLENITDRYSAYANYKIVGAGVNGYVVGDELRTNAVYQVRITDEGNGIGGTNYLTASNASQGGTNQYVILAGSDTKAQSNYVGMRVFINSGTGAGQYGYIAAFDDINKRAQVLKESFSALHVTSTTAGTDRFNLLSGETTSTLYVNQPVQFIPTYYSTTATETSVDSVVVTQTIGGVVNEMIVTSTAKLSANMAVTFSGTTFGGVTDTYTYYIKEVINSTTITLSTEIFGPIWLLQGASGTMTMKFNGHTDYILGSTTNMKINMPINFTGTSIGGLVIGDTYYINDVISSNKFTVSTTLKEVEATATNNGTKAITVASTTGFQPLNPIMFSGTTIGGIAADTKYYISEVVDGFNFTLTTSLLEVVVTATESGTNLITVDSTAGFIAGKPIIFSGNTFGNIYINTVYYILAVAGPTQLTISSVPNGSAISLATAAGEMSARTSNALFDVTTATGSMTASTTTARSTLTVGYGALNATFFTTLFGGVSQGTTYYIKTIGPTYFTVSPTVGGNAITLSSKTGSMNLGESGWDHINPGTAIELTLDSSSAYFVEPRTEFTAPPFAQATGTTVALSPSNSWTAIGYGDNTWVALPNGNQIGAYSLDGTNWTAYSLPSSQQWTDVSYGNNYWVAISKFGGVTDPGSTVAVSNSNGKGWRTYYLPSKAVWKKVAYGNGRFVAVAGYEVVDPTGTPVTYNATSAYSTSYGASWTAGTGLTTTAVWTGLTFGLGKFVAVASGGTVAAYSSNGASWTSATLPSSTTWSDVAFGDGMFVAVSSTSANPAYSPDGITWSQSNLPITADKVAYGQGVFVAVSSASGTAYTSEDGIIWTTRTVANQGYGDIVFGFDATNDYVGRFVTVAAQTYSSTISAGIRAKGRAVISSGKITSISLWEPGSGYTTDPTLTFTDPNVTKLVTTQIRRSNGVLGNPTFINRGEGYNTTSTAITITGGGYADTYQVGLTITVKDLSLLPRPGDNLVIAGNDKVYKVTNATAIFGTVAPNIKANIQISPDMTTALSPDHEAAVTIRQKYSQCRLTGHDFLNVGYGNFVQSNYPGEPANTILAPQDQAVETNYGRVFYTSTDQDGNFRVGNLFAVEQATGIVTLSASQFGLTGLETLSLGGIAVGGSSVVVTQFSTDVSFIANSNTIIPTQRAIKEYLSSRLSQGGSNTFTGQLIAGTVLLGGADRIASTIPEGTLGSSVKIPVPVNVHGEFAGWDGDGAAFSFFMKNGSRRGNFGTTFR
jgi:hypothetical protein